jgi:hypothetical protein
MGAELKIKRREEDIRNRALYKSFILIDFINFLLLGVGLLKIV